MMNTWLVLAFSLLSLTGLCNAAGAADQCRSLKHHGKERDAKTCFTRLAQANDPLNRAEGLWGLGEYQGAKQEFAAASKSQPSSALVRVEWGNLFLERFNPGEAANLFNEAVKIDENFAPAYLGLARVAAQSYSKRAPDFARQALKLDDKYVEAREFLAFLALE